MAYSILIVVIVEGLIALGLTRLAWILGRKPRFLSRFLCGLLVGMAWCPFLHGFFFGILGVEGSRIAPDAGLLAGFGVVAAVLPGFPLGIVIGLAIGIVGRLRKR